MSEAREFRIYASSQGDVPVLRDIREADLESRLRTARAWYPQDTLYVREVLETVVKVVPPDGRVVTLDDTPQAPGNP